MLPALHSHQVYPMVQLGCLPIRLREAQELNGKPISRYHDASHKADALATPSTDRSAGYGLEEGRPTSQKPFRADVLNTAILLIE